MVWNTALKVIAAFGALLGAPAFARMTVKNTADGNEGGGEGAGRSFLEKGGSGDTQSVLIYMSFEPYHLTT